MGVALLYGALVAQVEEEAVVVHTWETLASQLGATEAGVQGAWVQAGFLGGKSVGYLTIFTALTGRYPGNDTTFFLILFTICSTLSAARAPATASSTV